MHQSVVEVSLESADEALLLAARERGFATLFWSVYRRARVAEARADVEVRRADDEGVRQKHEQHEPLRAPPRKVFKT